MYIDKLSKAVFPSKWIVKEVSPSKWIVKKVSPSKWLTITVPSIIFKAFHSDSMFFMLFGKLFHNIWYHRETFLGIFTPKTSHLGIFGITFFFKIPHGLKLIQVEEEILKYFVPKIELQIRSIVRDIIYKK